MAEWLKAHAWKACLLERVTWVRIPLSPPFSLGRRETRLHSSENAAIPRFSPRNRTGESVPRIPPSRICRNFLRRPHVQSGFDDSIRRMQCDQQPCTLQRRLDFPLLLSPSDADVSMCSTAEFSMSANAWFRQLRALA